MRGRERERRREREGMREREGGKEREGEREGGGGRKGEYKYVSCYSMVDHVHAWRFTHNIIIAIHGVICV